MLRRRLLTRRGRTETLRAGSPVAVGAVTLLPIERVVVQAKKGGLGVWYSVAMEPYALVVRDAAGIRAVDTDNVRIPFEELREKIPGLDALLASM